MNNDQCPDALSKVMNGLMLEGYSQVSHARVDFSGYFCQVLTRAVHPQLGPHLRAQTLCRAGQGTGVGGKLWLSQSHHQTVGQCQTGYDNHIHTIYRTGRFVLSPQFRESRDRPAIAADQRNSKAGNDGPADAWLGKATGICSGCHGCWWWWERTRRSWLTALAVWLARCRGGCAIFASVSLSAKRLSCLVRPCASHACRGIFSPAQAFVVSHATQFVKGQKERKKTQST